MKLKFNKRWWFHFGEKSITIEVAGFDSTPAIGLEVDGGERDFTISLAFGIAIYLKFERFLPNSWYPQDSSETYGSLPGRRDLSLRFHHWSIWWNLWKDDDIWSSGDSKWRHGSFHFDDLIFGKHKCEWEEIEREMHIVSMLEGNYSVEVQKKLRIDSWERWPTRKSISFEVTPGYYDQENQWIGLPIPVEGKGENSWDCEEDARFSSSFPAKTKYRVFETCQQAALYFENDMKKDRFRRGGKNWLPKAFKGQGIKLIRK